MRRSPRSELTSRHRAEPPPVHSRKCWRSAPSCRPLLRRLPLPIPLAVVTLSALCSGAGAQAPRSVWEGVYTTEQAKQGQAIYKDNCSACHGDSLDGQDAPALSGTEFLSNWNGLTVGDLFERIRTTMPQNKAGSLSREQNAAIVAYIFSACRFPAGKSALPQETEVLKKIRIDASKPEKR
jgi:S-disulfanyl-L-cysteine oxidoreductase SoxD